MPLFVRELGGRWNCTVSALGGHLARQAANGAPWPYKVATKNVKAMPKSGSDQWDGATFVRLVALSYAAGLIECVAFRCGADR